MGDSWLHMTCQICIHYGVPRSHKRYIGGSCPCCRISPKEHTIRASVWNDGGDGKSMLPKFQLADQPIKL